MIVAGTMLAYSHPLVAIFLIGLGMQQAGWLGHDFVHGRVALLELSTISPPSVPPPPTKFSLGETPELEVKF